MSTPRREDATIALEKPRERRSVPTWRASKVMVGEHVRRVCPPRRDRVRGMHASGYPGRTAEQLGKQAHLRRGAPDVEYGASRHVVHGGSREGQRGHENRARRADGILEHADGVARLAGKAGKLVVRAVDQQNIAGLDSHAAKRRQKIVRSKAVPVPHVGQAQPLSPAFELILGPFREQIYEPSSAHRREPLPSVWTVAPGGAAHRENTWSPSSDTPRSCSSPAGERTLRSLHSLRGPGPRGPEGP